jgi:hypothetical protein
MGTMIAFCGLDCGQCPAYLATQADDDQARAKVAEQWRVEFNTPGIQVSDINCDGCTAQEGRHFGHCFDCNIRSCGVERGVENCAYCAEYEDCAKLNAFLAQVPFAKACLDQIRQS